MKSSNPGSYRPGWVLIIGVALIFCTASKACAAEFNPYVVKWLERQGEIITWSADLVQTRTFKSLAQPLVRTGHIWFASPDRFRWEIGNPAETIALRQSDKMQVIYPLLKRVEEYPLGSEAVGPWRDALALLEAGFPRSQREMESRFRLVSQEITNQACSMVLEPKSSAARKMIKQITVVFGTNDLTLLATALEFAGSATMRNDFTNAILNLPIDETIFSPPLPSDYTLVQPIKGK